MHLGNIFTMHTYMCINQQLSKHRNLSGNGKTNIHTLLVEFHEIIAMNYFLPN